MLSVPSKRSALVATQNTKTRMRETEMRGIKLFGGATVLALLAVAFPVAGASAKSPVLELSHEGVPLAAGAAVHGGFNLNECNVSSNGKLSVNGKSKDDVLATENGFVGCEPEHSISGVITEMQWGVTGADALKGKINITKPGPSGTCEYKFTKFAGTSEVPGLAFFFSEATGKLNKKTSNKSCEATTTEAFFADVANSEFEALEQAL